MKKSLLWLLIMVLAVSMIATFSLAGCKKEAPTEEVAEKEAPTEEVAEEAEEVPAEELTEMEKAIEDGKKYAGTTINVIVSGDVALSTLEGISKDFEDATGISVDLNIVGWDVLLQQVPISLTSGASEFDVVDLWEPWIDTYGSTGALVDLGDYMSVELESIAPEIKDLVTIGDNVPGFVLMPSWEIMFYNKELVEEAGLDPNKPPETMDEFYEWVKELSLDTDGDGSVDRYALIVDFTTDWGYIVFQHFHKAFGGVPFEIVDGKVHITFDTPEMEEAINYLKKLYDEGLMAPGVLTEFQWDVTSMYGNEEIPLLQMWEMYTAYLDEEIRNKTGFFAFPGKEKGTYAGTAGHEILGIPSSSPNIEAAKAYIKYACSHENTRMRVLVDGTAPLYLEDWEDPEILSAMPFLEEVKKARQFETPRVFPVVSCNDLLIYTMTKIHEVLLGTMTTEECLKDIQAYADTFETLDTAVDKYQKYMK